MKRIGSLKHSNNLRVNDTEEPMPYFTALRFAKKHDGIESLKKFIKMLDRGESGDIIAKEFDISPGRVSQLSKLFGKFHFEPCEDVLDYIEQQSEDRLETAKDDLEFVHKQRAKVIPLFDEPKKMEGE